MEATTTGNINAIRDGIFFLANIVMRFPEQDFKKSKVFKPNAQTVTSRGHVCLALKLKAMAIFA